MCLCTKTFRDNPYFHRYFFGVFVLSMAALCVIRGGQPKWAEASWAMLKPAAPSCNTCNANLNFTTRERRTGLVIPSLIDKFAGAKHPQSNNLKHRKVDDQWPMVPRSSCPLINAYIFIPAHSSNHLIGFWWQFFVDRHPCVFSLVIYLTLYAERSWMCHRFAVVTDEYLIYHNISLKKSSYLL